MAKPIPRQRGDTVILFTEQSFTIYAAGQISTDGQQDFHAETDVRYVTDCVAAEAQRHGRLVRASVLKQFLWAAGVRAWRHEADGA